MDKSIKLLYFLTDQPALCGDAIFMHLNYATILAKYDLVENAEADNLIRELNCRMCSIRQSLELMYGQLFNLFHLLQMKWQIKYLEMLFWRIVWVLYLFCFKLTVCLTHLLLLSRSIHHSMKNWCTMSTMM